MVLDTRDIIDSSVRETVLQIEVLGEDQYAKFIEERLVKCEKHLTEPITKNKLALSVVYPGFHGGECWTHATPTSCPSHIHLINLAKLK